MTYYVIIIIILYILIYTYITVIIYVDYTIGYIRLRQLLLWFLCLSCGRIMASRRRTGH